MAYHSAALAVAERPGMASNQGGDDHPSDVTRVAAAAVHRPARKGRAVKWSELTKPGAKADAIEALLAVDPKRSYQSLADELGTTRSAVGGVMFRSGRTVLHSGPRDISAKAHPIVRSVFTAAYNAGLTDTELAKRAGYAMETLWNMRSGARGCNLNTICDIAEVAGVMLVVRPIKVEA